MINNIKMIYLGTMAKETVQFVIPKIENLEALVLHRELKENEILIKVYATINQEKEMEENEQ